MLGYAEASAGHPGGVRVRFKRYGAATKAFIDRANTNTAPAALCRLARDRSRRRLEAPVAPPVEAALAPSQALLAESDDREPAESSGVHRKAVLPVAAPADREALLNRLRARRAG